MTKALALATILGALGGACTDGGSAQPAIGGTGGKADGVGPGSGAAITFASETQKGGLWELGTGDLFTAFESKYETLSTSLEKYSFSYGIVEPGDTKQHDVALLGTAGSCTADYSINYECIAGLSEPSKQQDISIVTNDDRILMAQMTFSSGAYHPRLIAIDPTGAKPAETIADLASMTATISLRPELRLRRLPTGEILFSAGFGDGTMDRTFVLDDSGSVQDQIDGFGVAFRGNPDEILLRRTTGLHTQEFAWWNRATAQTSFGGSVPKQISTVNPITPRIVVTPDRGLALYSHGEDRVVRISATGALVKDEVLPTSSTLIGVAATGDALIRKWIQISGGWDWSVVSEHADGTEQTIYSKATLEHDAGWHLAPSSFSYPHLEGIESPVFDDAGNSYVPFVAAESGSSTQTYLAGFDATGDRMFGVELESVYSNRRACVPHSILPSGRIAVLCESNVTNHLYLLGD